MSTFRWKNCFADVLTSKHDLTIHSYLDDVIAIAAFWRYTEYICNESIEQKHENLEAHLVKQRAERTWFPQAGSEAC